MLLPKGARSAGLEFFARRPESASGRGHNNIFSSTDEDVTQAYLFQDSLGSAGILERKLMGVQSAWQARFVPQVIVAGGGRAVARRWT